MKTQGVDVPVRVSWEDEADTIVLTLAADVESVFGTHRISMSHDDILSTVARFVARYKEPRGQPWE
jgi:hypothetical protein